MIPTLPQNLPLTKCVGFLMYKEQFRVVRPILFSVAPCIVSFQHIWIEIYIYIYCIYINVYIFMDIFIVFIYTYIYIDIYLSFFSLAFSKQTCFANVEFRDNSFSVRGVWWLRHGSDSSRSQLGLQRGTEDFSVVVPNGNRHRHLPLVKVGPQKNPIYRWDYGPSHGPSPKKTMGKWGYSPTFRG